MLKQQLASVITHILAEQSSALNLPDDGSSPALVIERPKMAEHGDYAVNVSPLAKHAKMAPPQIAAKLTDAWQNPDISHAVVGGFINFKLSPLALAKALITLHRQPSPGENTALSGTRCLMEFVSANPTGPLHIGHGRWVALGDTLARIMTHSGAKVTREFYINDAGSQMFNIANSLWYRSLELLETGGKLPEKDGDKPYPFYPGEYVIDLAKTLIADHRDKLLAWDTSDHTAPAEAIAFLTEYAKTAMLAEQKNLMQTCGLTFDVFYAETTLHASGLVEQTLDRLKQAGVTYEKDSALWLASTRYGDDQDRVLIKSDGKLTYLTADIAYHVDKYTRDNGAYNRFINIWGADHHGYIARMRAALIALGLNADQFEVILGQLVNLLIDGERTRMGKRKKMLTLADLVEEVGVDAVRFWMVSKSQDTALDFNVELAQSKTDENPVFYAQYAHARCCSILRNALEPRLDTVNQTTQPPLITAEAWADYQHSVTPETWASIFESLETDAARACLRELILKLDSVEDRVADAAGHRSPHILARYVLDLAAEFHRFYAVCRVLVPDAQLALPRLLVIDTLRRVLAQALDLLGVSAPESM